MLQVGVFRCWFSVIKLVCNLNPPASFSLGFGVLFFPLSASIIAFPSLHLHLSGSYTLEAECVGGCCNVAVPSLSWQANIDGLCVGERSASSHTAKIRKEIRSGIRKQFWSWNCFHIRTALGIH